MKRLSFLDYLYKKKKIFKKTTGLNTSFLNTIIICYSQIQEQPLQFQNCMVEISAKGNKQRVPRQPKTQIYTTVNAYSHTISKQQIMTIIIFIIQVAVHQIFVTPKIGDINNVILWILFGFRYGLILLLAYDYYILTIKDPVDRLIIDQSKRYKYKQYQLRYCSLCVCTVQRSSHHCMNCDRCTQDFDHHCKYLNNCIGVRNYENFIRLLFSYIIFSMLGIGMAIWVIVQSQKHILIENYRKWILIVYIIISGLIAGVVISLLAFHIYISCCVNMTTLEYIYHDPEKQYRPKQQKYVVNIQPAPLSAQNFRKTFQYENIQDKKLDQGIKTYSENEPMEYYRK